MKTKIACKITGYLDVCIIPTYYLLPPLERPPEAAELDRELLLLSALELLVGVELLLEVEDDSTRVEVDLLEERSEPELELLELELLALGLLELVFELLDLVFDRVLVSELPDTRILLLEAADEELELGLE